MFFAQTAVDAVPLATHSVDDVVNFPGGCRSVEILDEPDELGEDERLVASYLIDLENAESSLPTEKVSSSLTLAKSEDECPFLQDKSPKDSTSPKKRPNKAVNAQTLLSCSDKCSEAIKLLEGTLKKQKSFASTNKDINLSLKALKVINSDVEKAAVTQLSSYDQAVRKRKRVEEEDLFWMSNHQNKSQKAQLHKSRSTCRAIIDKENTSPSKKIQVKKENLRQRFIKVKKESKIIMFPFPKNGEVFSPTEMCENLMEHVSPPDRRFVIKQMYKEHFIPVQFDAVLKHLQRYKKGQSLPIRYKKDGRSRYISHNDVGVIQDAIVKAGGRGLNISDARKIVQEHADKRRVNNGQLPSYDGGKEVSTSCVRIYLRELAQHPSLGVTKKVAKKTVIRDASENSLRSTTTYLLTIATTHFIEGSMPSNHPARKRHGTAGAQKLVNMIRKTVGKKVEFYPILRSLLYSTDDTTLFISPGKIKSKTQFDEVLYSTEHDKKTQMVYSTCDDDTQDSAKGMRVKLTFTFSGAGQSFAPYVTVSGLTERELPVDECPSGILVVPIPGLCMERNRDPSCNKVGYVVFLRQTISEESVHLKNHVHYHQKVYRPTVSFIRKSMFNFSDDDDDVEVPDNLTSVGWNDGDVLQLKAIVKNEIRDQCLKCKNHKNKQSAKRSGVEQPCDVAVIFNNLKFTERSTTIADIPLDSLSSVVNEIFSSLKDEGKLFLKGDKSRILRDFLARLPYMLEKTCTCDNIVNGFVDVGMLDSKDKLWPDYFGILKTKRQNITKNEMVLIEKNFKTLFNIMSSQGHIPEEVFDEMGFPKDEVNGQEIIREQGIEQEWMQRAKNITHWYQQELRDARAAKLKQATEEKERRDKADIDTLLGDNRAVESALVKMIEENNRLALTKPDKYTRIENTQHCNANLHMFSELKRPELTVFVRVRLSSSKTICKKTLKDLNITKLPNKGSLEEAKEYYSTTPGKNLITLAFHLRSKDVQLKHL